MPVNQPVHGLYRHGVSWSSDQSVKVTKFLKFIKGLRLKSCELSCYSTTSLLLVGRVVEKELTFIYSITSESICGSNTKVGGGVKVLI